MSLPFLFKLLPYPGLAMTFTQQGFDVRCEWGAEGIARLAPLSDVVIVVDVLSFSTSVTIAVGRGATIFPFGGSAEEVAVFATSVDAEWADPRRSTGRRSLSPVSLLGLRANSRLVLPSPNGSALSLAAHPTPVLAGCLRNARAIARAAGYFGTRIAVIPAGERWRPEGSLRPSFEDWLGAGAIVNYLSGAFSPEARAALAAFTLEGEIGRALEQCSSGKELIARGFAEDVRLAGQLNADDTVPVLAEGAFVSFVPAG